MTDPVAPLVAGYEVTGLLGAGSGGEVWLGRDRGTGEQVALKRVRPGAGLAARDRLRREAAALAGLTHPHVLRLRSVVGCLDTPDDLVLVLDAALGGSLARVVARQGPRPAGQVVTVLVAVADALAAVHRAGLVHGDVTPSNVLVATDGRPVLGDLGSARLGGAEPVGTPGFADRTGPSGPATDVHGVAATCVFLLTGRPPYDPAGVRVPPDGDISASGQAASRLMRVLDAALHPDPRQRPDAAGLARAAFDAVPPEPLTVDPLEQAVGSVAGAAQSDASLLVDGTPSGTSWGVPITQLSAAGWTRVPEHVPGDRLQPAAGGSAQRPGRPRGAHARPRPATARAPASAALRRTRSWSALGRSGAAALATAVAVVLAAVTGIAWAGAGPAASPGRQVTAPSPPLPASASAASAASASAASPTSLTSLTSPTSSVTGAPGPAVSSSATPSRGRASTHGAARLTPEHTWSARLRALDEKRSAAFAAGDTDALKQVYADGSPALRRDRRLVRQLAAEGLRAAGVRLRVVQLRVVSTAGHRVRLAVMDELAAYRLLDAQTGSVVERRPGRGPARWVLTMARQPEGWRLWEVTRR
ncbi:MAG TPA: serine/threonine-protein kinase [Actinomycetes bacterium]|nr:serine/threonine-protein kinase [Actinomycetes bacterium]